MGTALTEKISQGPYCICAVLTKVQRHVLKHRLFHILRYLLNTVVPGQTSEKPGHLMADTLAAAGCTQPVKRPFE